MGRGAGAAAGDVRVAARVDGVGSAGVVAAGVTEAMVGKGGTGEDFLATRVDDDDTLVLLDEIEDDRDLRPVEGLAPARLFNGLAPEDDLALGERGLRGVLREFLRALRPFNERSRPITGHAGVAPPPDVVVVVVSFSGRGRSGVRAAVEEGVFARFLGNGSGGFSFM